MQMIRRPLVGLVLMVAAGPAHAQNSAASGSQVAAGCVTAQSATNCRDAASRGSERRSVRDFGAACDGTTDDSVALATAAAALANTGTSLHIPGNCRIRMGGAAQVWLRGLHVVGDATFEPGVPGSPSRYGQQGSTVLITDATKSPFLVSSGWAMSGLIFNWPAQTEAASVANSGRPIVFPPLITNHGADQATFWSFDDNQVENAYDIIDLANAGGVGHFHFTHNLVFALRYHFVLKSAGGESFVTDNQFSPAAYEYEVLGYQTTHLRDFAAANAEILHIIGDGTPRAVARTAVEGMRLSGNYAFVLRYGIHAAGGTFGIGALVADSFDQVQTVIGVDSGGLIDATTVTGGTWLCQRLGNRAAAAPCVDIDGGAPGNSLTLANVQVPVAAGAGIRFNDTWTPALSNLPPFLTIIGGSILNVGETTTGNAYSGVSFNAPQGILTLSGTTITTKAGANALGVVVDGAKASVMSGVTLGGFPQSRRVQHHVRPPQHHGKQ